MGNVSPAHDLLTGYLRSYWGVVLVCGVGAVLQVRLIVRLPFDIYLYSIYK